MENFRNYEHFKFLLRVHDQIQIQIQIGKRTIFWYIGIFVSSSAYAIGHQTHSLPSQIARNNLSSDIVKPFSPVTFSFSSCVNLIIQSKTSLLAIYKRFIKSILSSLFPFRYRICICQLYMKAYPFIMNPNLLIKSSNVKYMYILNKFYV